MNAVIYYSNTNQSRIIAEYIAGKLNWTILEISAAKGRSFENAVLVFPVYCQNIPDAVKDCLKELRAENLSVAATYGRMSFGNVLNEVQNKYQSRIVAAAYIPTKHTYLEEAGFSDFESLKPLIEKIKNPSEITVSKSFKNPLADICPALRSRMGVRIAVSKACTGCGLCEKLCEQKAVVCGKVGKSCIRCLKCVTNCPSKAMSFRCRLPMKLYLKKKKLNKTVLYV